MNTSKLLRAYQHWMRAFLIVSSGNLVLWFIVIALFDLNTEEEKILIECSLALTALICVLWAKKELDRESRE